MSHLVGQGARTKHVGRADGPAVAVLEHDAVLVGVLVSIDRTGVERVARCACRVLTYPNVQVLVARPLNERLHFRIADVRELAHNAVDAGVAVAVGVALGQTKFDLHVRHQVFKFRDHFGHGLVQGPEVGVQHVHGIVHLRRGNVLRTVEVDDVKDHGNNEQFFPLSGHFALLGFEFELSGSLDGCSTRFRTMEEKHFLGVVDGTGRDAVVRVGLGEKRGGQSQQGCQQRQTER